MSKPHTALGFPPAFSTNNGNLLAGHKPYPGLITMRPCIRARKTQ